MTGAASSPLLRGENICVRIGGRAVLDQVSLELRRHELVALVGPNGAGKTTLIRALAGLLPCTGEVQIEERALRQLSTRERACRIAYLPQGHVFHWPMAVAEIVALGRQPHASTFAQPSPADEAAVVRAMRATGVETLAARSVLTLSGGERARVSLARALATEAPILLADEPTASLDPRHQLLVMTLLRRAAEKGGAVLAIVHDLTLAARFANRVLVMDRGRIVAGGTPAEVLDTGQIASVFGIETATLDLPDGPAVIAVRPI